MCIFQLPLKHRNYSSYLLSAVRIEIPEYGRRLGARTLRHHLITNRYSANGSGVNENIIVQLKAGFMQVTISKHSFY